MSRDIKFRIWNVQDKKMTEPFTLEDYAFDQDGEYGEGKFSLTNYNPDSNNILLQYTGLKDENSKEIYEGDIVVNILRENIGTFNVPDDIIANGGYTGRNDIYEGKVVYNNLMACFGTEDKVGDFTMFITGEDTTLEVIGNIYENPELFK